MAYTQNANLFSKSNVFSVKMDRSYSECLHTCDFVVLSVSEAMARIVGVPVSGRSCWLLWFSGTDTAKKIGGRFLERNKSVVFFFV